MDFHYHYRRRNAFANTHGDDYVPSSCRIRPDYYSPGSKVKDFYPLPANPGTAQETPMKPSHIQNRYPPLPPPPRKYLTFRSPSPERHHRHPWHPPRPPRHNYHTYHPRNSPVQSGDNENHHYHRLRSHMPRGAVHRRPVSPPPQSLYSRRYQDATGQSSHYWRDEREKTSDSLEWKDHTGQEANEGNKVQSSSAQPLEGRVYKPLVQRSDSWSPGSSHGQAFNKDQDRRASFPPADSTRSSSTQSQPRQLALSTETSHTNAHPLLQKRRRESGNGDDDPKKQCLHPTDPDGTLQWPSANVLSPHSSQKPLSDLELLPKSADSHLWTESVHPTTADPVNSQSHLLKPCLKRTSMGAKQACIQSTHNNVVLLSSPMKRSEVPTDEECKTKCNPNSSETHKRVSFNIPNDPKIPSIVHQTVENKVVDSISQKPVQKHSTKPSSCRKRRQNKKTVIADDIQDLFTPDPNTYIVNSGHKTLKVWPDEKTKETTDKNSLSSSVSSNLQTPGPKLCQIEKTGTIPSPVSNAQVKIPDYVKISLPSITLTRILLPTTNAGTKSVDSVEKEIVTKGRTSVSPSRTDEQSDEEIHEESLDMDLELNFDMDLEVGTIHSSDSEDEPLVSLQEIMTKKDMPERRAFSKPSTHGHGQHHTHHHSVTFTKTDNYKNSLDQMLKELQVSKRAKETETELLTACQDDLLRMAEYEEAESREESISIEQQQFLQRFSLTSSIFRDVPPGHEVFNLEKFGRIFNQNTLQLRHCKVTPQNIAQKTLLWSSPAQFKPYINYGLFKEAYDRSPCPFQITQFLFKMLSVHSDRLLSDKILQALTDVANTAAVQRVNGGDERFKVWVPSLEDITLVLMNMGAPFVSLFPLESLQPPFTEGDLLKDACIKSESPFTQEPRSFPEHNCTNIYRYLSHCLFLCPRFYSDSELLLLLTLLCTISLESRLLLHTTVELCPILPKLLQNIRRWDDMMPKMCQALTDLTDDHHNMCHLVNLLPRNTRGMKFRQHLCVSMISKLLDGSCLYTPKSKELQLCDLRPYLPRMKPSFLLRTIMVSSSRSHTEGEEDNTPLDQQAYYLCYSLLTLVNGATNFQSFPAHQKEQLLCLCAELERHIKCHIREGEKWLYRSKVKDLVARIYTKWQMMLQKTRPLNGKLYDYWQPLEGDVGSSQDIEEIESSQEVTEKDSVSDDAEEEAGAKIEDEEEEKVTEMEMMQNECKEKEDTFKETSHSNAAEEDPEEETRRKEDEMDKDRTPDQMDTKDPEEGCIAQLKVNSTFELDSEGGTNTERDGLCEDGDRLRKSSVSVT